MNKGQFKTFVDNIVFANMRGSGEIDLESAASVKQFDSKLAAMIQTIGETKIAIAAHVEAKRER